MATFAVCASDARGKVCLAVTTRRCDVQSSSRTSTARPWLASSRPLLFIAAGSLFCRRRLRRSARACRAAPGACGGQRPVGELLAWLASLGARGLDGLRLAPSLHPGRGLGVFATRDFQPGSTFCEVPAEGILVATPGITASLPAAASAEAALAAALLRERALGRTSRFAPYVASLPRGGELATGHPLFWPDGLRAEDLLAGSAHGRRVAAEVLGRCREDIAALVASGVADNEEEARWALAVVDSRAFTFQPDRPNEQLALVPLLDMLNTFSLLQDDEALWQCTFTSEGTAAQGAALSVEREICKGDEVLHLYSSNSSAMQWMVYGFLEDGPGDNPFETAGFMLNAESEVRGEDKDLASAKLSLLSEAGLRPDRLLFELPGDSEIGGPLLPVARVLSCSCLEEVKRVAPALEGIDDPEHHPRNSGLELELRARRRIASWLRGALRKCDETGLSSQAMLHKLATMLYSRERPVLELELHTNERFTSGAEVALAGGGAARSAFELQHWDDETGWLGAG